MALLLAAARAASTPCARRNAKSTRPRPSRHDVPGGLRRQRGVERHLVQQDRLDELRLQIGAVTSMIGSFACTIPLGDRAEPRP